MDTSCSFTNPKFELLHTNKHLCSLYVRSFKNKRLDTTPWDPMSLLLREGLLLWRTVQGMIPENGRFSRRAYTGKRNRKPKPLLEALDKSRTSLKSIIALFLIFQFQAMRILGINYFAINDCHSKMVQSYTMNWSSKPGTGDLKIEIIYSVYLQLNYS